MKTKILKALITGISCAALICGCSSKQQSQDVSNTAVSANPSYTDKDDSGTDSLTDMGYTVYPERGLALKIDAEYEKKGVQAEPSNENLQGYKNVGVYYYYKPITDPLLEEMTDMDPAERTKEVEDEFYKKMYAHSKCLLSITMVPTDEFSTLSSTDSDSLNGISGFDNTSILSENNGFTYLISLPDNEDTSEMGEEELAQYKECQAYMEQVKNDIKFISYEAESDEASYPKTMPVFSASAIDGTTLTDEYFESADVTVVNLWGTFCTPCIDEMPELAAWAKESDANVQFLGLVCDVEDESDTEHLELAKKITSAAGVKFPTIIPETKLTTDIVKHTLAFPTTFLVDKFGNIVPDTVVEGANVAKYKENVENYLKELEEDEKAHNS